MSAFRAEKVIEAGVDVRPLTHLWSSGSFLSCLTLFAFLTLNDDRKSVKDKNYYNCHYCLSVPVTNSKTLPGAELSETHACS